jgi:hypothetical protein
MSLLPGHRTNFDTLQRAALNNDLALMDCRHRDTGEPIAVLSAANRLPRGEIGFVPLAMLFNDNPFDFLVPPTESDNDDRSAADFPHDPPNPPPTEAP